MTTPDNQAVYRDGAFAPPPPAPAPAAPASGMAEIITPEERERVEEYVSERTAIEETNPVTVETLAQAPVHVHKDPRIDPYNKSVLITSVSIVGVIMLMSFVFSFGAIYSVTEYTGAAQILWWLPPLFIDLAITGYSISLIVFRALGEPVRRTIVILSVFSALSVALNVAHTISFWDGDLTDWHAWVGVIIAAAAPVAVLLSSEEISRLAFIHRRS